MSPTTALKLPCSNQPKMTRLHGRYGAVMTSSPNMLSRTCLFLLDQMYTSTKANGDPKNGCAVNGDRINRQVAANSSSTT